MLRFGDSRPQQRPAANELETAVQIDVDNLPDQLIATITNIIKQERPDIVTTGTG
jgi:hypothetical protein